jgi:chromosome segregation ATPase
MEFQHTKKQLNPDLFSGQSATVEIKSHQGRVYPMENPASPFGDHELKLAEARRDIKILSDHLSKTISKFDEFSKSTNMRMDRVQNLIQQYELKNDILKSDLMEKTQSLNQKLTERRTLDLKTQDLIDRHNQMIKGYEARLQSLMKIINEKDHQLLQAQATLNGAKMEIARLKRL